jgi:hypothetical protein
MEVAQAMFTHVSKCKNNKIKRKKEENIMILIKTEHTHSISAKDIWEHMV